MNPWNIIAIQPMTNVLIVLSSVLFNNIGLAIIALTIIINAAMLRLTLKQVRVSKVMQGIQPKMAELKRKYAKDKERLSKEQMQLYKDSGVSPTGCIVPMLIQMPVWIALYQSIIRLLGATPEDFLGLPQLLYSWPVVYSSLPLVKEFLWLNLGAPDIVLAFLVGGAMFVQQKMTSTPGVAQQSSMMLWMMPIMFGYITLLLPSGLALYWVTSSLIRIGIQYAVGGAGGLIPPGVAKRFSRNDKRDEKRDDKYKKRIERSTK
ncbi:YidC/Oxa1 family membrane protein insertase [Chloroflexota bacterium]